MTYSSHCSKSKHHAHDTILNVTQNIAVNETGDDTDVKNLIKTCTTDKTQIQFILASQIEFTNLSLVLVCVSVYIFIYIFIYVYMYVRTFVYIYISRFANNASNLKKTHDFVR
jgi:hypothetical protein